MNEADQVSSDRSEKVSEPITKYVPETKHVPQQLDFKPSKAVGCALFIQVFCYIAVGCAWVLPNLIIGNRNKDKECPARLWSWIQVFIYLIIGEIAIQIIFVLSMLKPTLFLKVSKFKDLLILVGLFMIGWIIVGLVWATKDKKCGTLYTIVLTDCLIILCSVGLCCVCGCCIACCVLASGGDPNEKLAKIFKRY
ncbi:hypothetical protein M0812_20171 [Anaeramoeba flamelloides]|uniref:Uncharacterized protein n=1 Tax=Anaeramoeba flamelloides TaxID=1746091 RepID=A0AAV7YZA7_9EUKA|nr:hypothetical protein M0812_20171 [Anaeramoeba flamelloides]